MENDVTSTNPIAGVGEINEREKMRRKLFEIGGIAHLAQNRTEHTFYWTSTSVHCQILHDLYNKAFVKASLSLPLSHTISLSLSLSLSLSTLSPTTAHNLG